MKINMEEGAKWDRECRQKNDRILHLICFGIISMCHYFIISNEYLLYFIPLILSLLSIGADWYSNWEYYHKFEWLCETSPDEAISGKCKDPYILVPFAFAILTYLTLLTDTFLINLF